MRENDPYLPNLHASLLDHPKTVRLQEAMRWNRAETVGSLVIIWLSALRKVPKGVFRGSNELDDFLASCRFSPKVRAPLAAALIKTGWLDPSDAVGDTSIFFHEWDQYGGLAEAARERLRESGRKGGKASGEARRSKGPKASHSLEEKRSETPKASQVLRENGHFGEANEATYNSKHITTTTTTSVGSKTALPTDGEPPPPKRSTVTRNGDRLIVPDDLLGKWRSIYPRLDVPHEVAKAEAWLLSNPKRAKKNYARFLNGWMARANERLPPLPEDDYRISQDDMDAIWKNEPPGDEDGTEEGDPDEHR